MNDCELIEQSILIVQAEFIGSTGRKNSFSSEESTEPGVLKVYRVFKGSNTLTEIHIDQPNASGPISSSDIFFTKGQKGIWFLSVGKNTKDGIYYANDPQRYWSEDNADRLIKSLHNCSSQN